jgi:hypothetical protein
MYAPPFFEMGAKSPSLWIKMMHTALFINTVFIVLLHHNSIFSTCFSTLKLCMQVSNFIVDAFDSSIICIMYHSYSTTHYPCILMGNQIAELYTPSDRK